MAPILSKIQQCQSSLICLTGISAAAWIILYGKTSNKKRYVCVREIDCNLLKLKYLS